jgi:hypothetical protein
MMIRKSVSLLLLALAGCALGPVYEQGVTTQDELVARQGPPAYVAEGKKGEQRLFWPTGPMGTSTIMARFDAQNRLLAYEEVLDTAHFSNIQAGMSMDDVQREIGPPWAPWTVYFAARDEIDWEWRYCDSWGEMARFNVLFDGTTKKVRSTLAMTDTQRFGIPAATCGHVYVAPLRMLPGTKSQ